MLSQQVTQFCHGYWTPLSESGHYWALLHDWSGCLHSTGQDKLTRRKHRLPVLEFAPSRAAENMRKAGHASLLLVSIGQNIDLGSE